MGENGGLPMKNGEKMAIYLGKMGKHGDLPRKHGETWWFTYEKR